MYEWMGEPILDSHLHDIVWTFILICVGSLIAKLVRWFKRGGR